MAISHALLAGVWLSLAFLAAFFSARAVADDHQRSEKEVNRPSIAYSYLSCLQRRSGFPGRSFSESADCRKLSEVQALVTALTEDRCLELEPEQCANLRDSFLTSACEDLAGSLPTRYEDALTFSLLGSMSREIERTAHVLGLDQVDPPLFGTLETARFNASAILVPDSFHPRTCWPVGQPGPNAPRLIIFERQLFTLANLMAKAIINALPYTRSRDGRFEFSLAPADVRERLSTVPEVKQRFAEVMDAILAELPPGLAPPYVLLDNREAIYGALRDGMELFIVAHEYSHVYLKHHGGEAELSALSVFSNANGSASELPLFKLTRRQEQEFEADGFGLMLYFRSISSNEDSLHVIKAWAPYFFVSIIEMIDRAQNFKRTGKDEEPSPTTHPKASWRREMIMDLTINFLGGKDGEQSLGSSLHKIVDILWKDYKNNVFQKPLFSPAP